VRSSTQNKFSINRVHGLANKNNTYEALWELISFMYLVGFFSLLVLVVVSILNHLLD